jgi:hypothetical protein
MTDSAMEMHTEEIEFQGLSIKFFVKPDPTSKNYVITCKAFNPSRDMLWATELLDETGKPQQFHSLATAVTKTRKIFSVYKKESTPA